MPFTKFNPDLLPRHRVRAVIEPNIIALLSGPAAEYRRVGRRNHIGASLDWRSAIALGSHLEFAPATLEPYLQYLGAKARELVDFHWPCVQAVAVALLERPRLTGREAKAICAETVRAAVRPLSEGMLAAIRATTRKVEQG